MTISYYQEAPTAWLHCRIHCTWVARVLFHAWNYFIENQCIGSFVSEQLYQSVKKWGILLICFFKYCTTRNAHLLILFIWRVPVSDQPLPLLPVLKLASLTILPEQLLSSSHAGPGDAFSVKSSSSNHPRPHRFALAAFWRQSAVCCFSLLMMNWLGNWKHQ